jgi:hypothetical protein
MFIDLKNTVDAVVTDLRFLVNTQSLSVVLVSWADTLERYVQVKPQNEGARDALIMTGRDAIDYLSRCIGYEEDAGHTFCAEQLRLACSALRAAFYNYDN